MKFIFSYSLLSNGHIYPAILPVGSVVNTQWGLRPVVSNHVEVLDNTPDCPPTC